MSGRAFVGSCLLLLFISAAQAQSPPWTSVFVVNTTADLIDDQLGDGLCHTGANTCSLRAAFMQANHLTQTGSIRIDLPAGHYLMTRAPAGDEGEARGDLDLSAPLVANQGVMLRGAGAAVTIIDGNRLDRVLQIAQGRTVSLTGLTIRNGRALKAYGGGIQNGGVLSLSDCIVEHNDADYSGGGIESDVGTVHLLRSTLRVNTSDRGGGIAISDTAGDAVSALTVIDSVIEGNTALYEGGGIDARVGTVDVVGSSIRANSAGTRGGGMQVEGASLANIRTSSIHSNHADAGGGIFHTAGLMYVVNSTLSGNTADTDGGGIDVHYDPIFDDVVPNANLFHVSVIGNDADHDRDENGGAGGGLHVVDGAHLSVFSTLVAANTQRDAPIDDDCQGTVSSAFRSLFGATSGCALSGSWAMVSPQTIGPLQDNGGPSWTHALLPGSEAIDATVGVGGCIDPSAVTMVSDQRGATRPYGLSCDIGAFEFGALPPLAFGDGFE